MNRPEIFANQQNLSALTQALSKAGKVYQQRGQFNELKNRFQAYGLDGITTLPSLPRFHPRATPNEFVEQVLAVSLAHPNWGCMRIASFLKSQTINLSSPTIQKILIRYQLGSKHERLTKLEEKALLENFSLTPEQITLIENNNPCFRERNSISQYPGEVLVQDTIFIGIFKGIGKLYLQAVVDTYSNLAFGFLHVGKLPDFAVFVLHQEAFPFFKQNDFKVTTLITDNGREYCGGERHHFEIYLMLNDIKHLTTEKARPANGFIVRFKQTVLDEFTAHLPKQPSFSLEELQARFEQWLIHYNTHRPHNGYPNMGSFPRQIIKNYKK